MQPCTTPTQPQIRRCESERFYLPDHRDVWTDIVPGLEDLLTRHPDNDWSVESIRTMLDDDLALLMVDEADPTSFAVVRFDDYPYKDDEREMFVHIIYCQTGNAFARWYPHFEVFARHAGAKHMRFYARRRAFLKIAHDLGYTTRAIEYVKELNHG